jgi:hypothetical protein
MKFYFKYLISFLILLSLQIILHNLLILENIDAKITLLLHLKFDKFKEVKEEQLKKILNIL